MTFPSIPGAGTPFSGLERRGLIRPDELIVFDPRGFSAIFQMYSSIIDIVNAQTMIVLSQLGASIVPILQANTPRGVSGLLAFSTRFTISIGNVAGQSSMTLQLVQDATKLGYQYAEAVRKGRRPGKAPPYKSLIGWVQTILGIPHKDSPRVAFAISMGIKMKGIQPNPYLENTLTQSAGLIQSAADQLGKQIVTDLNGGIHVLQERQGGLGL